jgi:hypothetical protein
MKFFGKRKEEENEKKLSFFSIFLNQTKKASQ